jgi:hypothetical protein
VGIQKRGPVEGTREAAAVPRRQGSTAEDRHAALAQQMAEAAHRDARGDRSIGDHQVERVEGEVGEEPAARSLPAHEMHRLPQPENRLEQPVGHELRNRIGDADGEAQRAACGPAAHRFRKLAAVGEDLVRVAVDGAAHVGQHERTPAALEEGLPELPFELTDLGADRGLREPQHGRGAGDAPLPGDVPEVEQVVVVEPLHGGVPLADRSSGSIIPSQNIYWTE